MTSTTWSEGQPSVTAIAGGHPRDICPRARSHACSDAQSDVVHAPSPGALHEVGRCPLQGECKEVDEWRTTHTAFHMYVAGTRRTDRKISVDNQVEPPHEPPTPDAQHVASLTIDRQAREVTLDGQPVTLTRSEYQLLSILMASPGKAFSARQLLSTIWKTEWAVDVAPLHVLVSRLRQKLGESGRAPRHLISVYGYGYRFEPHPPPTSRRPLRATVVSSQLVHVLISANRTLLWLSDNVHHLLGRHAHELQGRHICSLVHPEHMEVTLNAAERASSGSPVAFTWQARTGATRPVLIHARVRPLIDATESVRAYLAEWHPQQGNDRVRAPRSALRPIRLDPIRLDG